MINSEYLKHAHASNFLLASDANLPKADCAFERYSYVYTSSKNTVSERVCLKQAPHFLIIAIRMNPSWFILVILAGGCLGVKTKFKEWRHSFEEEEWKKMENRSKLYGTTDDLDSTHVENDKKLELERKLFAGIKSGARTGIATSHSRESRVKANFFRREENFQENNGRTRNVGTTISKKDSKSHEKHVNGRKLHNNKAHATTPPRNKPSSRESEEKFRRVHPRQVEQEPPSTGQLRRINLGRTSLNKTKKSRPKNSRPKYSSSGSREISNYNRQRKLAETDMVPSKPAHKAQGSALGTMPVPHTTPPPRFTPQLRPKPVTVILQPQSSPQTASEIQYVQSRKYRNSHESEESREKLHKVHPRQANQPVLTNVLIVPAQPRYGGKPPRSKEDSRESGEQNNLQRANQVGPPTQRPPAPPFLPQQPQGPKSNSDSVGSWEGQKSNRHRQIQRPPYRTSPPPPPPPRPPSPRPVFVTSPPPRSMWPPPPRRPPEPTSPLRPPTASPKPLIPPIPVFQPASPTPHQPESRPSQPRAISPGQDGRHRWRRIRSVDIDERYRWCRHGQREARESGIKEGRYRWRRSREESDNTSTTSIDNERYRWRRVR